ncbi:MAG: porin [Rhodocyclales bacterium]|nr:porin [Rhodocyclales bacterium]
MNKQFALRKSLIATVVASAFGAALTPGIALASEADVMKKIEAMEAEIKALRAQVNAKAAPAPTQPMVVANSSPANKFEWYGRLDMGAESNNDGKFTRTVMQSFASRIGFKGERALTDDLTGLVQVETKVFADDGAQSSFASRNTFVGLKNAYGTVAMGNYDSPYKEMKKNVAFLEGNADTMEHIIHGKANGGILGAGNFHTRYKNAFQYWSPNYKGFTVKVQSSPDELKGTAVGSAGRRNLSSSVEYDGGVWNVGWATDRKMDFTNLNASADLSANKFIAGMKLGDLAFGAAFARETNHDAGAALRVANNWMVGAQYDMAGPFVLKANFGVAGQTNIEGTGLQKDGGKMFGLEADYVYDKQTMLYVYYAKFLADSGAKGFKYDAGENAYATSRNGDDASVLGLAIQYKF